MLMTHKLMTIEQTANHIDRNCFNELVFFFKTGDTSTDTNKEKEHKRRKNVSKKHGQIVFMCAHTLECAWARRALKGPSVAAGRESKTAAEC